MEGSYLESQGDLEQGCLIPPEVLSSVLGLPIKGKFKQFRRTRPSCGERRYMLHFRSCPPAEEHAHTGESLLSVMGGIGEGSGSMKKKTVQPSHQEWKEGALSVGVYKPSSYCQLPMNGLFITLNNGE